MCFDELSLDELLQDPIVELVAAADGLTMEDVRRALTDDRGVRKGKRLSSSLTLPARETAASNRRPT